MTDLLSPLRARASACELCTSTDDLQPYLVEPVRDGGSVEDAVLICGTCAAQLADGATLDPRHWFGLQETIWSEVAAVQALSWRLLDRLRGEPWAADVLGSAWLEEDVAAWAKAGEEAEEALVVVDSNGTALADGDSVTLIKDLNVKGANFTAKRGTMVKGIRLTADPGLVEGRVNRTAIYLKTEFLKKV
tara:strand:- start:239 stop:808 length:570 start_codon:yes stop_codon:yes gene_type:complete